jgi:uncharacterized protein involved in type VI secretion and phage assembly
MGLFDELGDLTKKQITKSELGDNRIFGTVIGVVTNNYSKEMPGRVCVQIPHRDKDANVLKWARLALPYAGKDHGMYFVPEIGDQVLLVFEDGNIEKPFIIGSVPASNSTYISRQSDENNQIKNITTKNGNSITLYDNKEGEGEKDRINIATSKSEIQITLDNESHKAEITDKSKKNSISMNVESGEINVKAEKKMKINVGDVQININGESGKISVKCGKYKMTADDNIKVETNGIYKLEGENTIISANSTFKASSGSAVSIEGSVIKLG